MTQIFFGFKECTCPTCGATFIPAPLHRFKIGGKKYCKYTCYLRAKEATAVKRGGRRKTK